MSVRAVVPLSAGLDSTTNLHGALAAGWDVVLAVTFDYGQRAARREVERARQIAARAGVPHRVVDLRFFSDLGMSSLTDRSMTVPTGDDVSIDDGERSRHTAKSVWVPNRNGIFLNVAAGFAEALGADVVVPGFNAEEGATFPDNTPAFMAALTRGFSFSTANGVRVECFTADMDKPTLAKKGFEWGVPFDLLWPCYFDGDKACGRCESCQRDKRAYRAVGIPLESLFEDPS